MTFLKVTLAAIIYPIKVIMMGLVYLYKILVSPLLPKSCRFYPTCSTYMILSIREWGFRGIWLGLKRICRCRPGVKGGCDYVPLNVKGESKWIY